MPTNHGIFRPRPLPRRAASAGFTLVELLLSITILAVLMLIVTNVIGVVQKTWVSANSRVSEFREARGAFDALARTVTQATLNVYWQSVDPIGNATSTFQTLSQTQGAQANAYVRHSELQFVSGRTTNLVPGAVATEYPGHGVFFQAPLGVASLVPVAGAGVGGGPVNTENMVNLLCGRGYFVSWGDDTAFRPAFLNALTTVRPRFRYRLMEYSPTAERNRIYDNALRPIVDPANPATNFSKQWFQLDLQTGGQAQAGETEANRAFVRPIADNVICLVVSPQLDSRSNPTASPASIAPQYEYDSLQRTNPGAAAPSPAAPQGTQHLLPPLIKLTMIVVDSAAGERLAEDAALRTTLAAQLGGRFTIATNYDDPGSAYRTDLAAIEAFLVANKLKHRVFGTTVVMKQARWSL